MDTLIVFAGKYGCTEKCAEMVAKKLDSDVSMINLKKIKTVDINKYPRIIIGSSLYYGKIQKEVAEFCSSNLDSLKGKKLGLFVCGMQTDAAESAITNNFPVQLLKKSEASEFFGGEFNFDNMNFIEKTVVKKIAKTNTNISALRQDSIDRFIDSMNSI